MRNKKFAKAISTVVAASIFTCAVSVNTSALCINDLFNYIQYWIRGGNCNIVTTTPTDNSCTDSNCVQTPVQSDTIQPATTVTTSDVQAVFELANKERKAAGLNVVTLSGELCKAADVRAKEIVRSFSHTRPNGTSCFTVLKENSIAYRYAGENIAYGQKTAVIVMTAWMNSAGHRANILNKNFGKIGIACYTVNGVKYWVQLFTN